MEKSRFHDLPNQIEFDAISSQIYSKVRELVGHDSLAKSITSDIQVGLLKEQVSQTELDSWIRNRVQSQTEAHIADLWDYCFKYALKLSEDPDLAQDTTQTVMIALLQSHQEVSHIKGWLKQSVYNQVMLSIKEDIRKRDLGKKILLEPTPVPEEAVLDEEQLERQLSDADLKRYLPKTEYVELREMRSYKTIKDYAQAKGINPGAARKRKHCILTDLKAAYLNEQGWVSVPEILDYRTLVNIKRFLNTLVEKNRIGDYKQIYHYCAPEMIPRLQETLSGVQEIFDWGITQTAPKCYQISICDTTAEAGPQLVLLEITINRANYIRITDCFGSALIGVINDTQMDHCPVDKGECLLTLEDIYRYTH